MRPYLLLTPGPLTTSETGVPGMKIIIWALLK